MAKFKFRFDSILKIREQFEEVKKNEFALSVRELELQKNKLWSIEKELEDTLNRIKDEYENGTNVVRLQNFNSYIFALKNKIEVQMKIIKEQEEIVDKYREDLIKATMDRKIMEKLKEKSFEKHQKEELKVEQSVIDEIVSYKKSKESNLEE